MKIALVCSANLDYMPYTRQYIEHFESRGVKYDVINWDRLQIDQKSEYTYRDKKKDHRRNYFDYIRYSNFIKEIISRNKYDRIIVFSLQLGFFLRKLLLEKYNSRSILDIRDYNKIAKYYDFKRIIKNTHYTVISSRGFLEWLIRQDNVIINHNTNITCYDKDIPVNSHKEETTELSYIGAIRDSETQIKLISELTNRKDIILSYHGEGEEEETKRIIDYVRANNIKNILITGKYQVNEEKYLYDKADIVNIIIPVNDKNSKTLLPNRLYNAVFFGKPVVTLKGNYVASVIEQFGLGLVINSIEEAEKIVSYFHNYDYQAYLKNRNSFLDKVIEENNNFKRCLDQYLFGDVEVAT